LPISCALDRNGSPFAEAAVHTARGRLRIEDARAVNAWALLSAMCFLTGAYPLVRVGRNIRLVAAQAPAD
jgi:hypothetical protein